ncbi:hypothetical protein N434_04630 [Rhizobium sp. UGM030330-04]|nr:hypothetical protein N434_04630 [Rhizobium sp. UGM030330-04]
MCADLIKMSRLDHAHHKVMKHSLVALVSCKEGLSLICVGKKRRQLKLVNKFKIFPI